MAGDILLYASRDITDDVIEIKTGDDVAHIEIYAGSGQSWASRNGIGVNLYPFRPDGLRYVRRPIAHVDSTALSALGMTYKGAPYNWDDIAESVDVNLSNLNKGYDCSHFATVLLRGVNCAQFDISYPEDKITPRDFKISPMAVNLPFTQ